MRLLQLRAGDVRRRAKGERHNRQDWIKAAICYVKRTINHKQVIVIVDTAPLVCHRGFRIMAHATCAGLVLSAAKFKRRTSTPDCFAAARP